MRYLAIGGSGLIGRELVRYFRIHSIDYAYTVNRECGSNQNCVYLDFSNESLFEWQPSDDISVAFICAGITNIKKCENSPEETCSVNVTATKHIVDVLSERNIKIVFLSSNAVFSGVAPAMSIDSNFSPVSEYGRQKAVVEEYIKERATEYLIVRLTKVVSPEMALFFSWIEDLSNDRSIVAYRNLSFSPVRLDRVAEWLVRLVEIGARGIRHISGNKDVSYYDFACCIARRMGKDTALVKHADVPVSPDGLGRYTSLDISDTKKELRNFGPGITDCVDYLLKR